ncbi:MAG: hypothetical protein U9Q77_11630 [Candidatus Marinimicrobia bacterium]|nr:hypothetical protein [Candidatus Neomarinimicrobiota bacterium]
MYQDYGKFDRAERLIQHVIEVFDLVEILPAESAGWSKCSSSEAYNDDKVRSSELVAGSAQPIIQTGIRNNQIGIRIPA